jgi:hypothetical protein
MLDVNVKLIPGFVWQKQMSTRRLFTGKVEINLRKKLVKCYIWSIALYGAETGTLWRADLKYLASFDLWCWRKMEKISWTDLVKYEETL